MSDAADAASVSRPTVNIRWFADIGLDDLLQVGGKNSLLGELIGHLSAAGVRVPDGFAITADAYRRFLGTSGPLEPINDHLDDLDVDNISELGRVGELIRRRLMIQAFRADLEREVHDAYRHLCGHAGDVSVAVRSSATAEDLPEASFAGQQETFLNVRGIDAVLTAIREVFASPYNDRAIAYRVHHGFALDEVALSAGIQRLVRSDLAFSGVMFTLDTESDFDQAVFITSSYGLGEAVVQGAVNPDEFYVCKPALTADRLAILKRCLGQKAIKMVYTDDPTVGRTTAFVHVDDHDRRRLSLNDEEVTRLAAHAVAIETHYGRPMDIERAKDGLDGQLYILQARPETVRSRQRGNTLRRYLLNTHGRPGPVRPPRVRRVAAQPGHPVHVTQPRQPHRNVDPARAPHPGRPLRTGNPHWRVLASASPDRSLHL